MESDTGVLLQEGCDFVRFMSGEIVQNDVDLLAGSATQHDLLQEQHKTCVLPYRKMTKRSHFHHPSPDAR
jgi:hypothetical protein